jgi:DUF4097 and DUF4098 domain-containing protein YvlB
MPKTETGSDLVSDVELEKISGGIDVQVGQVSTNITNSDSDSGPGILGNLVSSIVGILNRPRIPH